MSIWISMPRFYGNNCLILHGIITLHTDNVFTLPTHQRHQSCDITFPMNSESTREGPLPRTVPLCKTLCLLEEAGSASHTLLTIQVKIWIPWCPNNSSLQQPPFCLANKDGRTAREEMTLPSWLQASYSCGWKPHTENPWTPQEKNPGPTDQPVPLILPKLSEDSELWSILRETNLFVRARVVWWSRNTTMGNCQ